MICKILWHSLHGFMGKFDLKTQIAWKKIGFLPDCSCPNDGVASNMAPAHPHATWVAVYPALLLDIFVFYLFCPIFLFPLSFYFFLLFFSASMAMRLACCPCTISLPFLLPFYFLNLSKKNTVSIRPKNTLCTKTAFVLFYTTVIPTICMIFYPLWNFKALFFDGQTM